MSFCLYNKKNITRRLEESEKGVFLFYDNDGDDDDNNNDDNDDGDDENKKNL